MMKTKMRKEGPVVHSFDNPVINVYRTDERKPCVVVRPLRMQVFEGKDGERKTYDGRIERLTVLEGEAESVSRSSLDPATDYILCWEMKDKETGERIWKKLVGVAFPKGLSKSTTRFKAKDFLTLGLRKNVEPPVER